MKIAVIGGGMAGVSAAHHILALNENIEITIFEKEAELGGNGRTIDRCDDARAGRLPYCGR